MTEVLTTRKLTKHFGHITAVHELDLSISQGQIFGLLGPNGSGKTTTLGMILDVVSPSSGSYQWFGGHENVEARRKIGSILETPCFYPYLSAVQNLRIVAHIKKCGIDGIDNVLDKVDLLERSNDKFKTYSLGMKQRLSIAAALLADPPVLILDEPTNGLDPQGIAEVRTLIRTIAKQGKTILIASHLLDEVQKVCTHFCILRNGEKLHEGPVRDILGETNEVELACDDIISAKKVLEAFEGIRSLSTENGSLFAILNENFSSADVNKFCFDRGVTLRKLLPKTSSLEQEFLKILKEHD